MKLCGDSTQEKCSVLLGYSQALYSMWDVLHTVPYSHPDTDLARPRIDFQWAACLCFLPVKNRDVVGKRYWTKTNLSKYLLKTKQTNTPPKKKITKQHHSNINVNVTFCHLRLTGEICGLTSRVTPSHLAQRERYRQNVHPDAELEKHFQTSKYWLGKTTFPDDRFRSQQAFSASKS